MGEFWTAPTASMIFLAVLYAEMVGWMVWKLVMELILMVKLALVLDTRLVSFNVQLVAES
jgi:hypothetical protein